MFQNLPGNRWAHYYNQDRWSLAGKFPALPSSLWQLKLIFAQAGSAAAMPYFVSIPGARLMGQPLYRILTGPREKESEHWEATQCSGSFLLEVAHVTSGYISHWSKKVVWPILTSQREEYNTAPEWSSKYFENIVIYHRPTKQNYEAKSLDIKWTVSGKLEEWKTRHWSNLRSTKENLRSHHNKATQEFRSHDWLGYFINDLDRIWQWLAISIT